MVFTTLKFIIFFSILFFIYYLVPKKYQWILLLVGSYYFYAQSSIYYLIFLFFTSIVSYLFPIFIEKRNENKLKGILLFACIILLLAPLIIFKYGNFFIQILASISLKKFDALNLILPVGLSFYIFQSIGYCIDVYRGSVQAEHNFFKHALYVSYFPQLLQGPIGDYGLLKPQLVEEKVFNYDAVKCGLIRVVWGIFQKLVIANNASLIIDSVWNEIPKYDGVSVWIIVVCIYAIQLYADFDGYCNIAIGCSKMLGINMSENFDAPYFSKSIAEFWRRWHITLGTWFKNYVFYSLLRTSIFNNIRKYFKHKNRYLSNTLPTVLALVVVWLSIGLWHGADISYVFYGIFHGSFIIISTFLQPVYDKLNNKFLTISKSKVFNLFRIVRTFCIVSLGYYIFRPANINNTILIFSQMSHGLGLHIGYELLRTNLKIALKLFLGCLLLFTVDFTKYIYGTNVVFDIVNIKNIVLRRIIYVVFVMAILIIGEYNNSDLSQFAYFRF